MAVTNGRVDVGVSFFGLFIKSKLLTRLPFFSPRYAVSAGNRRYQVSKDCDPFVGRPLKLLAGHPVEAIVSNGEIFALRAVEDQLKDIILTCYLMPQLQVFNDEVLLETRDIMTRTLASQGVLDQNAVEQWDAWQH